MADKVVNAETSALKSKAKSEMIENVEVMNQQDEAEEDEAKPGLGSKTKPWGVIPAKKKLVKQMVAERIGQSIASPFNKNKNKQKINPGTDGSTAGSTNM
ncbi:unnamed protein product [Ilex paraguariensis]|uniref:Uncharacterized protein n=1 Tax=Ilex paraguariensis TaxID=185542 RepID=A0ABC8S8P0_9AQUA